MPRPWIESACKNSLLLGDGWTFFFIVCSCNKQSMRKHVQHKSSCTLPCRHQYSVWGVLFSTLRVNTNRPVHRLEILSVQSIPKRWCLHKTSACPWGLRPYVVRVWQYIFDLRVSIKVKWGKKSYSSNMVKDFRLLENLYEHYQICSTDGQNSACTSFKLRL